MSGIENFYRASREDEVEPVPTALLALSRYRRRRFDDAIEMTTTMLQKNYQDMAMWYLKCRALTARSYLDDTEMEEDGVAEILLDDHAMASAPRPGTSLKRPETGTARQTANPGIRPTTRDGRPLSGYQRPISSRGATGNVESAFQGNRPGTSRPITSSGRMVRLGTASMISDGSGPFINVEQLDLKKYASRPSLARALFDYLIYHEHNAKKAMELAAHATVLEEYKDWWWKARLGKCYYQLGLLRDAEKQFKSSIKDQDMITTHLELCKIYIRLDQPNSAIDAYAKGASVHTSDIHLLLGIARIYDLMNNMEKGVSYYEKVLDMDASNVEAIACLASNYFYEDQPEVSLRLYRRLLQMGVNNTEIWTNLGLCCFYSSQYDMTLSCFQRALALAGDDNIADVWYNIGQVAIGIGDLGLAYDAFKIAISVDPNHAESFNCLGVLELRRNNISDAKAHLQLASALSPNMHEPLFNYALLSFRLGDYQESYDSVQKVLQLYSEHSESLDLLGKLQQRFVSL